MEDDTKQGLDFHPAKRAKLDQLPDPFEIETELDGSNSSKNASTVSKTTDCEERCWRLTDSSVGQINARKDTAHAPLIALSLDQQANITSQNTCWTECTDASSSNQMYVQDDEDDDAASTVSNLSGLSDLSTMSGLDWKPRTGPFAWAQKQMELGMNPRNLLQDLMPMDTIIPPQLDDITLWKIVCNILSDPPRRKKLDEINTVDDVVRLLKNSKKIIVLTGAGVSVSSGIPDFRSRDGIYARLAKDFPDLPDPQAMFDIHYFRKDPRPFFKFAKEIYPGQFEPSLSHKFIKILEDEGKLLRNYSQNIDTLEQIAGIQRVIQCHGSFATATCTKCTYSVDSNAIKDDIFKQNIPKCPKCTPNKEECYENQSVMKPDIVFFGEGLADEFHSTMAQDKDDCDLLIVIGSSLKVRPVALIPFSVPEDVPQILINREPLKHLTFDVELLGDCDIIINELCLRLGENWNGVAHLEKLKETSLTSFKNNEESVVYEKPSQDISSSLNQNSTIGLCEERADYFRSKMTCNISANIPAGCYIFCPPNCYLFNGAEIGSEHESEIRFNLPSSDCDSRTSSVSDDRVGSASGEDSGVGDLRDESLRHDEI